MLRPIKRFHTLAGLSLILILLTACNSSVVRTSKNHTIAAHHNAARYLIQMAGHELDLNSHLIAATFADVNKLNQSSTFGRMASQQLVSQFVLEGYAFVEVLLRESIYIDAREGEFMLSRAVADISQQYNAELVLVGTYAPANDNIFVTAKLIRTYDNVIVASYDYAVPYTRDMRILLRPQRY